MRAKATTMSMAGRRFSMIDTKSSSLLRLSMGEVPVVRVEVTHGRPCTLGPYDTAPKKATTKLTGSVMVCSIPLEAMIVQHEIL